MPYEVTDNIGLLRDSIDHIFLELNGNRNLIRIAVEAHQVVLRSMVEALRGTNNLAITGRRPKVWELRYQLGNDPWKVVREQRIPGCDKAWRFSDPEGCPPVINLGEMMPSVERLTDDHLLGFYDFLAMVQTECRMCHYCMSKPVHLTDEEMRTLEWLHEDVRNATEHFVPKSYLVSKQSLRTAISICIRVSKDLLYDSMAVFPNDELMPIKGPLAQIDGVVNSMVLPEE